MWSIPDNININGEIINNVPFYGATIANVFNGKVYIKPNQYTQRVTTLTIPEFKYIVPHMVIEYGNIITPMIFAQRFGTNEYIMVPANTPLPHNQLPKKVKEGTICFNTNGKVGIVVNSGRYVYFDNSTVYNPTCSYENLSIDNEPSLVCWERFCHE